MNFLRHMSLTPLFAVIAAWALYESMDWPAGTRLFPWLVGIPILALSLIQLTAELTTRSSSNSMTTEFQFENGSQRERITRLVTIVSWIIGFAIGIWLLGFKVALVLMIFGYLKFQSDESWRLSLTLTIGGYVVFWGVFDNILHLNLPEPQLSIWSEKLIP